MVKNTYSMPDEKRTGTAFDALDVDDEVSAIVDDPIENSFVKAVSKEIEGKCNKEGFIKKNSCNILKYSCGLLNGDSAKFDVVYECMVCLPVENMEIDCVAKNITKAGIRAQYVTNKGHSPVTVYLARDNHYKNEFYNSIKENKNQTLKIKVLGVRFELNDDTIYVLGELLRVYKNETQKEKISIK